MDKREQGKIRQDDVRLKGCGRIPGAVPGEVVREALLAEMERCKEEVIVLQAGVGCGKTVLLAQLARRKAGVNDWIWTDDEDMQETCRRILSFILSSKGESESYGKRCCLFADGCEHMPIDAWEDIGKLLERARGQVQIFLSVRGQLPLFLARYLIQGKVRVFDAGQLCFGLQETKLFLQQLTGEDLSEQAAECVQKYTGGWPAGVAFVGYGRGEGVFGKEWPVEFDRTQLHNYIYYEIFRKFTYEVQMFLEDSALSEKKKAVFRDCAPEDSNFGEIYRTLRREISFFIMEDHESENLTYLPVFEEFLRERSSPVERSEIESRLVERETCSDPWQQDAVCLQVRCLGGLEVTGVNGKIMRWRTKKTRELFACLFFEEGRGVRKELLLERLWPDVCEKQANALFYTTMSYLRNALSEAGARELLVLENQSYRLDTDHIASDYQLLMEWNRRAKSGELPDSQETLEIAELYRECYMYGEDYLWLGAQREYVEQIYLQTVGKLAHLETERGAFGRAVLLLERAVEIDIYEVSLLELLVESLIVLGDVGTAKRYFVQLQRICEEELCQNRVLKFRDYINKADKKYIRRSV